MYVYEIGVTKSVTGHSLHLKLYLQNKDIANGVNQILKKVLTDPLVEYPKNWTSKIIEDSIKVRCLVLNKLTVHKLKKRLCQD